MLSLTTTVYIYCPRLGEAPRIEEETSRARGKEGGVRLGFLIFGFYCTSKNLLVKESLLVKVRQQVKKDLVKNVVM